MASVEMMAKVKAALGITGDYMDDTIGIYIDTVEDYMRRAGVPESRISTAAGAVARGVNDIWNNGAGTGQLSPAFYSIVSQLACSTM